MKGGSLTVVMEMEMEIQMHIHFDEMQLNNKSNHPYTSELYLFTIAINNGLEFYRVILLTRTTDYSRNIKLEILVWLFFT